MRKIQKRAHKNIRKFQRELRNVKKDEKIPKRIEKMV
jgi:hypothetical protein